MSTLRPYQSTIKSDIITAHASGYQNVLAVMPTGAGKTLVMADIVKSDQSSPQILIAHRQELVGQISMALARAGVYHRIVAPQSTIRFIIDRHVAKFGGSFEHPNAPVAVAGVDTLIRRTDQLERFLKQCVRWQTDEAHHLQVNNKWGEAIKAIGVLRAPGAPGAVGIGWTATPLRPAGQSLGRLRSGCFDHMVVGPSMRDLIRQGYLCEYRIYGPPSDMDTSNVDVSSSTGDYNSKQLRDAAHKSHITGDIVAHYLRLAAGKRGVTFAVDVALAEEHAEAFRQAGVPAAVLHAKTSDRDRVNIIDRFERGEILQIVNVDVLGEGFDCPAIEVVQFARPTQSYGLFVQQFGRGLRPLPGKSHGLIIDHVGNVSGPRGHGLPDAPREWSLDGDARNTRPVDDLPCRTCPECWAVFEGYSRTCPECGHCPERAPKSRPELVEGDLTEFTPELLARLRGEVERVIQPCPFVPTDAKTGKQAQLWTARLEAQEDLRTAMAWWAGVRRDVYSDDDAESYRRFWRTFGVDVLTAQTLDGTKSAELAERIWAALAPEIQEQRRARSPDVEVEGVKNKTQLYIERFLPVVSFNSGVMRKLAPDLYNNVNVASVSVSKFKNQTGHYRYSGGTHPSKYYAPDVDPETVRAELSRLHGGAEITFDGKCVIDVYIDRFMPVVSLNRSVMAKIAPDLYNNLNNAGTGVSRFKNQTGYYRYYGAPRPSKYYAPDVDPETIRAELSRLHGGAEITLLSSKDTESEAA